MGDTGLKRAGGAVIGVTPSKYGLRVRSDHLRFAQVGTPGGTRDDVRSERGDRAGPKTVGEIAGQVAGALLDRTGAALIPREACGYLDLVRMSSSSIEAPSSDTRERPEHRLDRSMIDTRPSTGSRSRGWALTSLQPASHPTG